MRVKLYSIFFVLLAALPMWADDSIMQPVRADLLTDMNGVELVQDSAVARLLSTAIKGSGEMVEIDGFRVQVYSSNQQQTAKVEALDLEDKLKQKINQTVYVLYLTPFWKVRIGDFRTYDEAKEYKKEFVQLFPEMTGDTYIVRDKVQVMQ